MSVFALGATSQASNFPVFGKCPMKPTHHCYIAECAQLVCEHSIPVLVLIGFGVGLAHCVRNFMNSPANPVTACSSHCSVTTAKSHNDN